MLCYKSLIFLLGGSYLSKKLSHSRLPVLLNTLISLNNVIHISVEFPTSIFLLGYTLAHKQPKW